jgi:hypothetical protein
VAGAASFLSSASSLGAEAAWPLFCATTGAALPPPAGAGAGGSPVSGAESVAAELSEPGSGTPSPPQPVNITQAAARPMPADHSIQRLNAPHSFLICSRNPRSRSPGLPSSHAPSLTDAEASRVDYAASRCMVEGGKHVL